MQDKSFYSNGLQFECIQCSRCCRFDPGYVFLSRKDLERLLLFMKMEKDTFIEKYCRKISMGNGYKLSLKEKTNYDCIFWNNGYCSIYEARPLQCRSYPFWSGNLISEEIWNSLEKDCPGINRGIRHSKELIEYWLEHERDEDYDII